jgi:short-subunit dehydrogenase
VVEVGYYTYPVLEVSAIHHCEKEVAQLTITATGWMASPHQNIYHATKHYVRAFSEALSVELRGYPGIVNTQLMPGPTHTQFITRAHAEEVFMMAASGAVEDPKRVARAGYDGLCKKKRMVFSSWNAAATALMMQLAPRSVHLTFASFMNAPLRNWARAKEPVKDQRERAADIK